MKRTTIYLEPELEVLLKTEMLRQNRPMASRLVIAHLQVRQPVAHGLPADQQFGRQPVGQHPPRAAAVVAAQFGGPRRHHLGRHQQLGREPVGLALQLVAVLGVLGDLHVPPDPAHPLPVQDRVAQLVGRREPAAGDRRLAVRVHEREPIGPGPEQESVDPVRARVLHAVQQPISMSVFDYVMGEPTWKSHPSWYLVAANDLIEPPPDR